VHQIEVLSYSSGFTAVSGGAPPAVYSAGYLGTALIGSLLLGAGPLYRVKRFLYLGVGVLVLGGTLLAVRNPFGWAYGLTVGLLLLLLFFREFRFSAYLTDLLGVLCLVDVFHDLAAFSLWPSRNDASILSELAGLPYGAVLGAWAAASAGMAAAAVAVAWRNLREAGLQRRPEWGEFRFVTRRLVERSSHVTSYDDGSRRRGRVTLAVYLSILGAALLLVVWSARFVLFQPWTAREWASAAAAGGRIYLFGGRDRAGQNFAEVYRIDPSRLRIRQITALPSPRFGMAAVGVGDKVYVLGGFDGRRVFDDILELDTRTMAVRLAGRLPGPRTFGAAAAADGALYYAGGWDGQRQLDEVLRIQLPSGQASVAGKLPSPREFAAAAFFRGRLYVIGGSDDRGGYLDEIVEMDPSGKAATRIGHVPSSRIRSAAIAGPEAVYLIGGWEGRKVDEVLAIRPGPGGIETARAANLPVGMSDLAAVGLEGEIYLLGGAHERFQRQIGFLRWDPKSGRAESLKFRSFLFW